MSRPSFLVPSDVSDSIAKRENCILFTQHLQYATFPLFSPQLTTHSTCIDTGGTKTHVHAHSDECKHTHSLSSKLKAFPPPCLFSSAVTFCPDVSLKSLSGSGGVISAALCRHTGKRDGGKGGWGMMSWCWIMRVNSALRVIEPSLVAWWKQPIVQYLSAPHRFPVLCFSHTWAGELSLTKSSITSPLSCPCVEAQIVGYHIKTQWIFLHSPLFTSHHLFHFSQSMLAPLLFFSLALFLFLAQTLFSLSLLGNRVTPASSPQNQCGGLFRQPGKCSISFFFLLPRLSNSPLHLSIRVWDCKTLPDWAGWRFSMQMTGIAYSSRNCVSALLWVLANFAEPPSQILVDQ